MRETQKTISDWATRTFGNPGTIERAAVRVNEEMAELLRAITVGPVKEGAEEAADVMICLARLAERMGFRVIDHPIVSFMAVGGVTKSMTAISEAFQANLSLARLMRLMTWTEPIEDFEMRKWIAIRECCDQLWRCCNLMGADLFEEVDRKMAINRQRKWKIDKTGHGYHVGRKGASA